MLTRQLISRQPKRIPHNLLMQIPLELKQDPTDRNPRRPVIKASLPLPHTDFIPAGVDPNICIDPVVESIVQSPQPPLDGISTDGQLRGGYPPVVIPHPQAVVPPYHGRPAGAAAGTYSRSTFAAFVGGHHTTFRDEPVQGWRGCGEGPVGCRKSSGGRSCDS